MQARLAQLSMEVDALEAENERTRFREHLLSGTCDAGRLAIQYMQNNFSHYKPSMESCNIQGVVAALTGEGSELPFDQYISNFTEQWWGEAPCLGSSSRMLDQLIHSDLTDSIHTSILDGHLLSVAHLALMCLCGDPELTTHNNAATATLDSMYQPGQQGQASLSSAVASLQKQGIDPTPVLKGMAVKGIRDVILWVGSCLLNSCEGMRAFVRVPPLAHMDAVIEKVGPSPVQLNLIIKGLQVFAELQRPLEQQQAEVAAQIHKLLLPSTGRASPPGGLMDPLTELGDGGNCTQLLALGSKMEALRVRFLLTDICACCFLLGQLTWVQWASFSTAMAPYPPNLLLLGRRLMCRASLQLPHLERTALLAALPRDPQAAWGSAVLQQLLEESTSEQQGEGQGLGRGPGMSAESQQTSRAPVCCKPPP